MMRMARSQPGFVAAILHRLAGIALALFLPIHFLPLGTALNGAGSFESFFAATNHPGVKVAEGGIVVALATHMALGIRVLMIEFLPIRERTLATVSLCLAAAFAIGVIFALNVQ